jgi:hypothetical protein
MGRYAIVAEGVVSTVVVWDGEAAWSPEEGEAVACPAEAAPGWRFHDGRFEPPDPAA